jgi:formylglycine-generating enzyme required for sulfatase activity
MIKTTICTMFIICSVASAQLMTETFGTGANQFSIDFVGIGNPGNQSDTTRPNGIGSVSYRYSIAKTEISRGMIEKVNATANLGIVYRDWGNVIRNDPDRAAVDMNWFMAASFVNYLNTSTGNQAAYKFTSSGFQLWSESDPGYNANNLFRNSLAKFVLPSRDEWYKAAYGSPDGVWYKYSNGSNAEPESVYEGTTGIVYGKLDQWGGAWQTLAKVYEAGALSPFGTMGQGGNAMEWTESEADGVNSSTQNMDANREVLGGHIGSDAAGISSTALSTPYPDYGYGFGFRVAMVPEPSALSLLAVGLGGLAMMRRRRS